MNDWHIILLTIAAAYLLGAFPTGVLISRLVHDRDIRRFGSGNIGATNIWRVFGFRWGLLVVTVDVGKGCVAAGLLPGWFNVGSVSGYAALLGLVAVAGHIWSPFIRFRGGKGIGAAFGSILALYPVAALVCLGVWVLIMALTRYASVASLTAAVCYPATLYWSEGPSGGELAVGMALPLLLLFTHRRNLQRLIRKEELKIGGQRLSSR